MPSLLSGLRSLVNLLLRFLKKTSDGSDTDVSQQESLPESSGSQNYIAWGAKIDTPTKQAVIDVSKRINVNPGYLMACIAFETGETFSPSIKNMAGSGATGLIQFMPSTARGLGTTVEALAQMTTVEQLEYVYLYFKPYIGRIQTLSDLYMAILYPKAIGKPEDYVLFTGSSLAYRLNIGLDLNRDGGITKQEAARFVVAKLEKGLLPENMG